MRITVDDQFDMAEALHVLAQDYGLYGIIARLDVIPFRISPLRDSLSKLIAAGDDGANAVNLYRQWEMDARFTPPYVCPRWADEILALITDESAVEG